MISVSRVIYTDDRPVAYLKDILPPGALTEEDLRKGFTGSVLDFLLIKTKSDLDKSFTDIQAVAATSPIAKKLEIQRGDVSIIFCGKII